MKEIRAVIVDDEASAISLLKGLLEPFNEINIESDYTDPVFAIDGIIKSKPDLLFLDIQMGKLTGFQVLEAVWDKGIRPEVIFITAFDEFAIEALRHAAVDYLLKPVGKKELQQAIERVKTKKNTNQIEASVTELLAEMKRDKRLRFNTRSGFVLIDPSEIVYCQADGNYATFYCNHGQTETVCANLSEIAIMLAEPKFTRVSRSYLINTKYLRKIDRKSKTVFLEYNNKLTSLKFSADRYAILDWLFGGGRKE